ncbi:Exosome complex component rrp43 [Erysiphe neolycopersici]|uniref:Ribosomal RNA-processing protein 43 n=1 Tax=Erysiphe neolycopersici TaxID=212602 RepID=A0A420HH99_9PEZI|nr:Exosome complex component rrp43 [Erysiphe neolycopersici]
MMNDSLNSTESTKCLLFAGETFAKLSPHPYLLAHLQLPASAKSSTPSRANGRTPSQFRPPHINNGSLTHAEGSAVVRIGDTTVVCGVRGEILLASNVANGILRDEKSSLTTVTGSSCSPVGSRYNEVAKELDLLVPNIELATGCSPNFLPGVPPTTLAQSLSTRIYALLHSSCLIDSKDLMIWYQPPDLRNPDEQIQENNDVEINEEPEEIKGFWTLYIDILFISLDGNPFDAAWAGVLSALRDTRLPKAYWDPDQEMVLCHNELSESKKLNLNGFPISTTATIFRVKEKSHNKSQDKGHWILIDPDAFEESLCDETVTVVIDLSKNDCNILSISKAGGIVAGPKQIDQIVSCAKHRWVELQKAFSC